MKSDAFEVLPDAATRDRLGRVTLDQDQRDALVGKFHASGLSQAKFCRREGINPNTLSGWIKRRAARESRTGEATSSLTRGPTRAPVFREVVVTEKRGVEMPAGTLTLGFPGGIEVRGCDVATAAELIRALREVR